MLLIIDNHDSFTFNLVDLLRTLKVPMQVVSVENLVLDEVAQFSHILISPGPDVPRAYPQLFAMLARFHQHKSILGVCLGHQTLCEFFGGQLYNLPTVRHGLRGELIQHHDNPLFADLPAHFAIGLYHSWAVDEASLAATDLIPTARCHQQILMAVKHQSLPIYGVQFHPESFITEFGTQILRNWLQLK